MPMVLIFLTLTLRVLTNPIPFLVGFLLQTSVILPPEARVNLISQQRRQQQENCCCCLCRLY